MGSEEDYDDSLSASLLEPVAPNAALRRLSEQSQQPSLSPPPAVGVGLPGGVLNLVKCILGAGLLSIPKAFSLLGAGLGTGLFALVSTLTVLTVEHGLVYPSTTQDGTTLLLPTYSSAVSRWVGSTAEQLLSIMMMIGMLGFEASYLDIIADVLLGSKSNPGLLTGAVSHFCSCNVFPPNKQPEPAADPTALHDSSSVMSRDGFTAQRRLMVHTMWADAADTRASRGEHVMTAAGEATPTWIWILDRRLVLASVVCCVLLPLSLRRHMGSLSAVNAVGLACLAAFLVSLIWLAVAAVLAGSAHALPLTPDIDALGSSVGTQVLTAFGVLSVLLTANGCHANMHPLMGIVQPFSRSRIRRVVIITIAITTSYYWLTSVCAYLVFGQSIQEDILTNLSPGDMAPLVGPVIAQVMSLVLRAGYVVSIMGSALLTMFPLRQAVFDLFLGPMTAEPHPKSQHFIPRTLSQDKQPLLTTDNSVQGELQHPDDRQITSFGGSMPIASEAVTLNHVPQLPYHPPVFEPPALITTSHVSTGHTTDIPATLLFLQEHEQLPEAGLYPPHRFSQFNYNRHRVSETSSHGGRGLSRQATSACAHGSQVRNQLHAPLSILLFGLAYLLAVTVPSIWVVVSLVGSCSATFLSFIMPATVGLQALKQSSLKRLKAVCVKAVLMSAWLLGGLIFVNGFLTLYLRNHSGSEDKPAAAGGGGS